MNPQTLPQPRNDRLDYGHTIEFGIVLDPDAGNPRGVLETARHVDRLGYDLIAIPAPAHPIGIWIGALRPQALALTGQVADGSTNTPSPPNVVR